MSASPRTGGDFLRLLQEAGADGENAAIRPVVADTVARPAPTMASAQARARQYAAVHKRTAEEAGTDAHVRMVDAATVLAYQAPGVQPYLLRKLRRGEYVEANFLDLHYRSVTEAYAEMQQFLADAVAMELRCVLIVHGKGRHGTARAVLKSYVAHWLKQIPQVLAYHSAPPHKGGTGALLVLLKKGPAASAANREHFAARGRV